MISTRRFWLLVLVLHAVVTIGLTYFVVPAYETIDGPPPPPLLRAIAQFTHVLTVFFCFPAIIGLKRLLVTSFSRPSLEYVFVNSMLASGLMAGAYWLARRTIAQRA